MFTINYTKKLKQAFKNHFLISLVPFTLICSWSYSCLEVSEVIPSVGQKCYITHATWPYQCHIHCLHFGSLSVQTAEISKWFANRQLDLLFCRWSRLKEVMENTLIMQMKLVCCVWKYWISTAQKFEDISFQCFKIIIRVSKEVASS